MEICRLFSKDAKAKSLSTQQEAENMECLNSTPPPAQLFCNHVDYLHSSPLPPEVTAARFRPDHYLPSSPYEFYFLLCG